MMALISRSRFRTEDAIFYSEREYSLYKNGSAARPAALIRVLALLAAANAELGRLRKANEWIALLESALDAHASTDATLRWRARLTVAYVAAQSGDLRRAESTFEEVSRLTARANVNPLDLGSMWSHLGRVRRRLGNYSGAEQCHLTSLSILKNAVPESHPFIAYAWLDLADTYRLMRRYDDAIAHYRKGLAMAELFDGRGSGALALDYEMFAAVLQKNRHKDEARHYLALAQKAKASGGPVRGMGFTVDVEEFEKKKR
jgi:tetratricopeptide (TPR) repeat protein